MLSSEKEAYENLYERSVLMSFTEEGSKKGMICIVVGVLIAIATFMPVGLTYYMPSNVIPEKFNLHFLVLIDFLYISLIALYSAAGERQRDFRRLALLLIILLPIMNASGCAIIWGEFNSGW